MAGRELTIILEPGRAIAGNAGILFLKGVSYEGMQKKEQAAKHYYNYLQVVRQGDNAKYAYKRLKDWGYVK